MTNLMIPPEAGTKVTKDNASVIYAAAYNAAVLATNDYLAQHGDHDACGFAWVVITPARGPMVNWMKQNSIGKKPYGESGYHIWNPSEANTQSITPKEVGARAFADVLKKYGIKCYMNSRLD